MKRDEAIAKLVHGTLRRFDRAKLRDVDEIMEVPVDSSFSDGWAYSTRGYIRPLHVAARFDAIKIASALLRKGANVNAQAQLIDFADYQEEGAREVENDRCDAGTPLHIAVVYGAVQVARLLIGNGADMYATLGGELPISLAIANDSPEAVTVLLEGGMNVNVRIPAFDCTPLYLAISHEMKRITQLLLEKGASVQDRNGNLEMTALHNAAAMGLPDVAQLLIERQSDINATDVDARTPLHDSVAHDSLDVTRLLLERGARASLKDKHGKTPLSYARSESMKQLLKAHGAKWGVLWW